MRLENGRDDRHDLGRSKLGVIGEAQILDDLEEDIFGSKGFNLAFEAVQPLNSRSGSGTGFLVQFQKFFAR